MSPVIDLTGKRFGRLVCIRAVGSDSQGRAQWLAKCDCGNETVVRACNLRQGWTQSCGCLKKDRQRQAAPMHGLTKETPRLHRIWKGIKRRCYNPHDKDFPSYGARGIKLCQEWFDYRVFYAWAMSTGYKDDLSIDRIDNAKGYEPGNCRWATPFEQGSNMTNNVHITFNGETKTVSEWGRELGIDRAVIYRWLASGRPAEELFLSHTKEVLSKNERTAGGNV